MTQQNSSPVDLSEIMEDLAVRFIFSCPDEEYDQIDRLMFQFELAHWFYLDEYFDKAPPHSRLPKLSFKDFCEEIFARFPALNDRYSHHVHQHIKSFQKYKNQVPVCGCLLLNSKMTKVLMVQAYGAKKSWNFPRGKINKSESHIDCAIRETYEEIGYAPQKEMLNENRYIETTSAAKKIRLYIVLNVDVNTHFQTMTTKEISKISWQSISKMQPQDQKYRYVWPLIRKLKQWIKKNKKKHSRRRSPHSHSQSNNKHQQQHETSPVNNNTPGSSTHQKSHHHKKTKNHSRSHNSSNSSEHSSSRGTSRRRSSHNKKQRTPQKKHAKPKKKSRSSSHPSISAPIPIGAQSFPSAGFPSANSAQPSPSFKNFSFDTKEMLKAIHG